MNKLLFVLLIFTFTFIGSCSQDFNKSTDDISTDFPIGFELSREILRNAEQVAITDNYHIILINFSKDLFDSEYYLLFFNNSLKLVNVHYLSSFGFDEIVNNKIIAWLGPVYRERVNFRKTDLPNDLNIKFRNNSFGTSHFRNKLILSIAINNKNTGFNIVYRTGIKSFYKDSQQLINSDLSENDSIFLPLSKIHYGTNCIFIITENRVNQWLNFDYYYFNTSKQANFVDATLFELIGL